MNVVTKITCPICETDCKEQSNNGYYETCRRCGKYLIETPVKEWLKPYIDYLAPSLDEQALKRQRMIASSMISEREKDSEPTDDDINRRLHLHNGDKLYREFGSALTQATLKRMLNTSDKPVTEKADRLLERLGDRCSYVGEELKILLNDYELHAKCWILDSVELKGFIEYLISREFVKYPTDNDKVENTIKVIITPNGWQRIEELQRPNSDSSQCFVAMWFDENGKMKDTREAIRCAIEKSGYFPRIIDEKHHTERNDDEIIKEIRRSKFMVADLTCGVVTESTKSDADKDPTEKEHDVVRGSVYYEAGFAHGLGLPVIFTGKKGVKPHFDVAHYNRIIWKDGNLDEFGENLTNKIEALFNHGPYKPSQENA